MGGRARDGTVHLVVTPRLPPGSAGLGGVATYSDGELTGACLSPDGNTLLPKVFGGQQTGSGFTATITRPWHHGVQ
jgi:hypothetical protein